MMKQKMCKVKTQLGEKTKILDKLWAAAIG
jgi:hypothetical protein